MRAIYLNQELSTLEVVIEGDSFHHLVNVVRVKLNDELLVLNGKGLRVKAIIKTISKKNLSLHVLSSVFIPQRIQIDLALGVPKKESLELCLRQATEIGFTNIYLVESDFSNLKNVEPERLNKILVSALEQSNQEYLPNLFSLKWQDISYDQYDYILRLDSKPENEDSRNVTTTQNRLLIVGPEGGFSDQEILFFNSLAHISHVHLPTGILRTSTAVSVGAGWLLRGLMD